MKPTILILSILFAAVSGKASDSTHIYHLPDSVKTKSFLTEIRIVSPSNDNSFRAGIKTDIARLYFAKGKKGKQIIFEFPKAAPIVASGLNVSKEKGRISFSYNWEPNENYMLALYIATDSAKNFTMYSAFAFLSKEKKWKFMGSTKIMGRWSSIAEPATFYKSRGIEKVEYNNIWLLRESNSWKSLKGERAVPERINLVGHIDSAGQRKLDIEIIENAIRSGKISSKEKTPESLYYEIVKQGMGRKVNETDSVSVYYHVMSLNDTTTIDEAKTSPVTFPLKRLVRAWQIGVPLCNTGCKIRIVAPSDLTYSVRPGIADIPPNTILIFDLEVLEAKPAK